MRTLVSSLLIVLAVVACQSPPQSVSADVVLQSVRVIDVKTGTVSEPMQVAIKGDRIAGIYADPVSVDDTTQIIDAEGQYLIPGLWDMHAHHLGMESVTNPLNLAHGVTGIREMSGHPDSTLFQILLTNARQGLSPEMYTTASIVDGISTVPTNGIIVSGPEEARQEVRRQKALGVDFVKVYSNLDSASYFALADECKKQGLPFAGHIPTAISVAEAIAAGQSSFEHLLELLPQSQDTEDSIGYYQQKHYLNLSRNDYFQAHFDEEKFTVLAKQLGQSDMWACPTLTGLRGLSRTADSTAGNPENLSFLPPWIPILWKLHLSSVLNQEINATIANKLQSHYQTKAELIPALNEAGTRFLAGSDYPNPHCFPGLSLHEELTLLVKYGLSPLEALQAATLNPAMYMERTDEFGTVEQDKVANLVLLGANPLEDIRNTTQIKAVILRGEVLDRAQLDVFIETAKKAALETPNPFAGAPPEKM